MSKNVVKREGFREKDKKGGSGHIRGFSMEWFGSDLQDTIYVYMYLLHVYMYMYLYIYFCSVNFFSISTVGLWDVIVILTAKHFLNVYREVIH